jgi:hypothetical protein
MGKERQLSDQITESRQRQVRIAGTLYAQQEKMLRLNREEAQIVRAQQSERDIAKRNKLELQRYAVIEKINDVLEKQRNLTESTEEETRRQARLVAEVPLARFENAIVKGVAMLGPAKVVTKFFVSQTWEFNRALIQTNSSLEARNNLFRTALAVQARTGMEMRNLQAAYDALRTQGQLYYTALGPAARTSQAFRSALTDPRINQELRRAATQVTMLHEALGVSVESGADLLTISRALGTSFERLGDTIATVADNTSLTGQEVTNIARQLGRVAYGYGFKGPGADVAGSTRLVAALQDQLNQLGAEGRDVATNLVLGLGDIRKLGGIGMAFGATPGLAGQGPERIRQVIGNVGRFLQQFQGNQWVFPQMAEMFGMSVDQAQALIEALPRLNQAEQQLQDARVSLEERYRNQSVAANKVTSQFVSSLKALALEALHPLLPVLQDVTKLIEWMRKQLMLLSDLPPFVKESIRWIGGSGLALGALAGVVKIISGFGALRGTGILRQLIGLGGGVAEGGQMALSGMAGRGVAAMGRTAIEGMFPLFATQTGAFATIVSSVIGALPAVMGVVAIGAWMKVAYEYTSAQEKLKAQVDQQLGERLQGALDMMARAHQTLADMVFLRGASPKDLQTEFEIQRGKMMAALNQGMITFEQYQDFYKENVQMLQTRGKANLIASGMFESHDAKQRQQLEARSDEMVEVLKQISAKTTATNDALQKIVDHGKAAKDARDKRDKEGSTMMPFWDTLAGRPSYSDTLEQAQAKYGRK